jgi:hypothetical protein
MMALLAAWRAARSARAAEREAAHEVRTRFDVHHQEALALAREAVTALQGEAVVTTGTGPDHTWVSAADPYRVAWEVYFDAMLALGENPRAGKALLDKAYLTW